MSRKRLIKKHIAAICIVLLCFVGSFTAFAYGNEKVISEETEETEETKESEEAAVSGEQLPSKPLFEFKYGDKEIKTYGTFSVIDGEITDSHRYFVKDDNLVVIDQNLDPTPSGVFIHYDDGKSYIVVLRENGTITSLGTEDELAILQDFKNSNIRSMAENITQDSDVLLFQYNNGETAAYDCVTGELLYRIEGSEVAAPTFSEYISDFISKFIDSGKTNGSGTSSAGAQSVINEMESRGITLEGLIDAGIVDRIASELNIGSNSTEPVTSVASADANGNTNPVSNASEQGNAAKTGTSNGKADPESGKGKNNSDKEHEVELKEIKEELFPKLNHTETQLFDSLYNSVSDKEMKASAAKKVLDEVSSNKQSAETKEYLEGIFGGAKAAKLEDARLYSGLSDDEKTRLSDQFEKAEKAAEKSDKDFKEGDTSDSKYKGTNTKSGKGTGTDNGKINEEGVLPDDEDSESKEKDKGKQLMKPKTKEGFVAVYNAEEGQYEIYSEKELLENPNGAENELSAITDESKLNKIKVILSKTEDKSAQRGITFYILIALTIVLIIVMMILFREKKKPDFSKEEFDTPEDTEDER